MYLKKFTYPLLNEIPKFIDFSSLDNKIFKIEQKFAYTAIQNFNCIIKFEGGFNSIREWIFQRLARKINISTQLGTLIKINNQLSRHYSNTDEYQIALYHIEKRKSLPTKTIEKIEDAYRNHKYISSKNVNIYHMQDFWYKDLLAILLCANEPPEYLISTGNILYLIDNSQFFSKEPDFNRILNEIEEYNRINITLKYLFIFDLCNRLNNLLKKDIDYIFDIPKEYQFDSKYDLRDRINKILKITNSIAKKIIKYGR